MSFMVAPIQYQSCECQCNCDYINNCRKKSSYETRYSSEAVDESYDFNTLRRQWSQLSKGFNFPYNKKMTGVFGLALFDPYDTNSNNSQCTCKDTYQQRCTNGNKTKRVCLCKVCKSAGCQVCMNPGDKSQKRLMASETVCYTCPCGNGSPSRLVYGYREENNSQDGVEEGTKYRRTGRREKERRQRRQRGKEGGQITSEADDDRSKGSPVRRSSSPTKVFNGSFKATDSNYKNEENLGTVYEKSTFFKNREPRECLQCRYTACGNCSICSPCPTCMPCSRYTSCNACGCRSCSMHSSCAKCRPCSPCWGMKNNITSEKQEPDNISMNFSDNPEEPVPEVPQGSNSKAENSSDITVNNPETATPIDRQSIATSKSYEADVKSGNSEQAGSMAKVSNGCGCMKKLLVLIMMLTALASTMLAYTYVEQTWPFKPKCSTRYHLYTKIKPYKR